MKTYRLITLVAAILITVLITRFLSDKTITAPSDEVQSAAVGVP